MAGKAGHDASYAEAAQASEMGEASSRTPAWAVLPLWWSRWPVTAVGLGLVFALLIVPGARESVGRSLRARSAGVADISAGGADAFVMEESVEWGGGRGEGEPPTPAPPPCSWPQENCYYSQCCNIPGHNCYSQTNGYGLCMDTCSVEPNPNTGKSWSCEPHGGYIPKNATSSLPAVGGIPYPTLFCFSAVIPKTPQVRLMVLQKRENRGIFACDNYTVLRAAFAASNSTVLKDVGLVVKYFGDIWVEVMQDQRYLNYEWTVKVDPDVVFLPDRLRARIQQTRPAGDLIYYKNTYDDVSFGYLGALMVFSKGALSVYLEKRNICASKIFHFRESDHMMVCMDAMGVGYFQDVEMLNEVSQEGFVDGRCGDEQFVAFHPYLHEDTWLDCYRKAVGDAEAVPEDELATLEE